jgi:malate dehydrogenase (oxaloacetate-decarboxylating)(NADP+)
MAKIMGKEELRRAALKYHEEDRRGKIEVVSTKPCVTQRDLSLAYTPGVAAPCLEIAADPAAAGLYTAKNNLVGVVSNGTAVLGLGNIGALAGKPVMEGKGILFKRFADIDVFDIELDTEDPDEIIRTVQNMEPTFGGINLEDIKAPECFYIEETLKDSTNIPIFHDDQHGTAIISGAAFVNAVDLVDKDIGKVRVVFSGAGAAGIACANFYISLGVKPENVLMVDSKGVLWNGRGDEGKNKYKDKFYRQTEARDLAGAMKDADAFCGVSMKDVLTAEMVKSMADKPIIFAMANPDPEIDYEVAKKARPDCIMATGRSDFPNQVNNVLGFPFIFRGALDVEASAINEEMKLAAAHALAALAREEVPEAVKRAYNDENLSFGPDYIIPKPFDSRVLLWEASAVAKAAMDTGVARREIDLDEYRESLQLKIDPSREVMRKIFHIARQDPKRIVLPEGTNPVVISAACEIMQEGIAKPILLGKREEVLAMIEEVHSHASEGCEIVDPAEWPRLDRYIDLYYRMRQRKGVTERRAKHDLKDPFVFAAMMVNTGDADAMLAGAGRGFPDSLKRIMRSVRTRPGGKIVAGMHLVLHQHHVYFLADTAVNVNPSAEELAEIALMSARELEHLSIKPRIALLSFDNFGYAKHSEMNKVTRALEIIERERPDLITDGPLRADFAVNPELLNKYYPFNNLKGERPNLLVFPNLDAGNISLHLLKFFGRVNTVGPIIMGMDRPVHLLIRGDDVSEIVNMAAIATVDAQKAEERQRGFETN